MLSNQSKTSAYHRNKPECKEIIDALMGDMGDIQHSENVSLRKSSRAALKSVFKDSDMGHHALSYFRSLKTPQNSYEELANADGDNEFKKRATDVQSLLSDNTRKLTYKDALSERIVGKKESRIAAGLLLGSTVGITAASGMAIGVTAPLIASTAALTSQSLGNIIAAGLGNIAIGYYSTMETANIFSSTRQENNIEKSVTKINPEKKVNTDSKGIDDKYKNEMQTYQDLSLDYKDLLFEKMTGKSSINYHIESAKLGHAVDSYVGVLDGMAKGYTQEQAAKDVSAYKGPRGENDIVASLVKAYLTEDPKGPARG